MSEVEVIYYDDAVKRLAKMFRYDAECETDTKYSDEDFIEMAARQLSDIPIVKIREENIIEKRNSVKCRDCERFDPISNYCRLWQKGVGLFDSCEVGGN